STRRLRTSQVSSSPPSSPGLKTRPTPEMSPNLKPRGTTEPQTSKLQEFRISKWLRRFPAAPFFEQSRSVAGDRMERRRPAKRAAARAPPDLIERQRLGVGAHLFPRLVERDVPDARLRRRVLGQRGDDLAHGLGAAVRGVVDAFGRRRADEPRVELAEIAVIN